MIPNRFRQSVENFFFDRSDQISPSQKSNEYHDLMRSYRQMYEQLKGELSPEMQEVLMKFTEVNNAMEVLDLNLHYEQAFLDGAQFMRYLLQIGEERIFERNK